MNNDLISREALKAKLQNEWNYNLAPVIFKQFETLIDNAPTVTPDMAQALAYESGKASAERPQGEWKYHKAEGYFLPTMECSECHASDLLGGLTRKEYKAVNKFCFNCGAKMKGGAE